MSQIDEQEVQDNKVRVAFYMPPWVVRAVELIAKENRRSKTSYYEESIEEFFDKKGITENNYKEVIPKRQYL